MVRIMARKSKEWSRNKWRSKILTMIGDNMASTNGMNRLSNKKIPQTTSNVFSAINKYSN